MGEQNSGARGRLSGQEIARLYRSGRSIRQIAAVDGRSHGSIHRILRRERVRVRAAAIPRRVRAAVAAAYAGGETVARICARFRVAPDSVRRIAEEYGVPLRASGARRWVDRDLIARLAGEGWPPPAVALLTGYSPRHVRRVIGQLDQAA
ncbi:helix-turn-helix domain-containing protein (plasmid) [Microtetraspora malaysiensis]|uniref:helix-turn-helix domain-containing protein n=1 Tax=Microtetraspora malaysiensis TaxID=161358 RepID=UPI003D93FE9F